MSDSPLGESLAALSQFFVGDGTFEQTLQRVTELTTDAVPPAALAGITMIVEGRQRTAFFTDPAAPEIDQAQYDTGEGPCLDAHHHGEVYAVDDTTEDGPWPAFRDAAAAHGIRSTLSMPLVAAGRSLGALNLYAHEPRSFGEPERALADQFAVQAAIVLANAQAYWDARSLGDRLSEAMKSRAVIEQAKGILMAAQRCSEDDAFELLVSASQRENRKLRDVATRIVTNATQRRDPAG